MKTTLPFLLALLLAPCSFAAPADDLVAAGRAQLAAGNLAVAETRFQEAVNLEPTHQLALFFHAAVLIYNSPADPQIALALDRLQIVRASSSANSWIWDFDFPGIPAQTFTHNESLQLAVDTIHNSLLPRLELASTHLSKLQAGFLVHLTAAETRSEAVTVDHTDTQIIRAGLLAFRSILQWLSASNAEIQVKAIESARRARKTFEQFLREYPQLLTLAAPARAQGARIFLSDAIAVYVAASAALRARAGVEDRLFALETKYLPDEQKFRETLQDVQRSLLRAVVPRHDTNITIRAGVLFNGQLGLRDFLPQFIEDEMVALTMNTHGAAGGDVGLLEDRVASIFPVDIVPRLTIELESDGEFGVTLAGESGLYHTAEFSLDLKTWQPLGTSGPVFIPLRLTPQRGFATVPPPPPFLDQLFLRARRGLPLPPLPPPPTSGPAPRTAAEFESGGGPWYLTPATGANAGRTFAITFSGGTYSVVFPDEIQPTTGTYTYTVDRNNPHRAHIRIQEPEGVTEVTFNFTAENAGTYIASFTPTGGGAAETEQGTFGRTNPNPNPNPGTNTNTNPGSFTLTGKRLNLFNDAGGEWIQFGPGNTFTSEIGGSGTYTWELQGTNVRAYIDFNSPASYANDFYDLTLQNAVTTGSGPYEGNFHFENTDHRWPGTYTLVLVDSPPNPNPGSFTVVGRTVQVSYGNDPGSAAEKFVFNSDGTFTSDFQAGAGGTYQVFSTNTNTQRVLLTYTVPAGDNTDFTFTKTTDSGGSYTAVLVIGGTREPISGPWAFHGSATPPSPPPPLPANFSLSGSRVQLGSGEMYEFRADGTFLSGPQLTPGGTYEQSSSPTQATLHLTHTNGDTTTFVFTKNSATGGVFHAIRVINNFPGSYTGSWAYVSTGNKPGPTPPPPPATDFVIVGRFVQVTYGTGPSAASEKFEFKADGTFSSDFQPDAGGTYTHSISSNTATVTVTYTGEDVLGDTITFIFARTSEHGGTHTAAAVFGGNAENYAGVWSFAP